VAKRVSNVYISNLNLGSGENDHYTLNEEWVEIFNNDTKTSRLDGLQLCDEDGNSGNNDHIFTIPPIMLFPGKCVRIYSGNGQNSIDLQSNKMSIYWNRISGDPCLYNSPSWKSNRGEIWDNQGDTAYLKDGVGNTLSMMSITFSKQVSA
jgi:hypothetical protein